ncbi:hypothetical protein BGX26_011533 [Mortierella sp. AD094]|nr:hypothetical protein BGX26_011533 [Mortierella sp. AD094]
MPTTSPLELPEILSQIISYLDLSERFSAAQVNWLWNKILQSLLPSGTASWSSALPKHERDSAFHSLCYGNIRSFECRLFVGYALYHARAIEDEQKLHWEPIKSALINGRGPESGSPEIQLQRWVVKGGNSIDEDFFEVLLGIKKLKHFWIDSLPGRRFPYDISKLFKVLGWPSLQTLRRLTVKNAWWPNTGFPFPNKVRCQLRKIVLENTHLTEPNLMRLLESCPQLEEFVAVDVIARWSPAILKHISKVNPLLSSLVISCLPSNSVDRCDDTQLNLIYDNLTVNIRTMGIYRLFCKPETFTKLQTRFKDLTRLEIYGTSDASTIHVYLSTAPQLRHLVARDVFFPISLLRNKEATTWICKDLSTLELSFGSLDSDPSEEQGDQIQVDSRTIFEYLVRNIPNVQHLWVQKHELSLKQGHGIELLKGLSNLKDLTIVIRSVYPLILAEGQIVIDNGDVEMVELKARLRSLLLQCSKVR